MYIQSIVTYTNTVTHWAFIGGLQTGNIVPINCAVIHRVCNAYTQRNIFEILLNQSEIRLYLLFSG